MDCQRKPNKCIVVARTSNKEVRMSRRYLHHFLAASLWLSTTPSSADQLQNLPRAESDHTRLCADMGTDQETLCEIQGSDASSAFNTPSLIGDALQIDIRPENCGSFFDDYLHTRRGLRIESALETSDFYGSYNTTVSVFPIVDFYANGLVRVVKTRDLTAESFAKDSKGDALYKQIIDDAKEIKKRLIANLQNAHSLIASSDGSTTIITADDVKNVVLDVVVQAGMATASHIEQLKRAAIELKTQWGFELKIIEIP